MAGDAVNAFTVYPGEWLLILGIALVLAGWCVLVTKVIDRIAEALAR